jgi:hypothetical protein
MLNRFFLGKTAADEEFILSEYFSSPEVAPEMEEFKKYFEFLKDEKNIVLDNPGFEKNLFEKINAKRTSINLYTISIYTAAAIVLLVALYFIIPTEAAQKKGYFAKVEDTYNDPYRAYAETKKALSFVSETMNKGTGELNNLSKLNSGMHELNQVKKMDKAVEKYNKIQAVNKFGKYYMSFN